MVRAYFRGPITLDGMGTSILHVSESLPLRCFGAGEEILRDGERTGLLYILISGTVQVVKGETEINTVSEPGAIFGEMSALLELPHTATVRTLEPTTFRVADNALEFLDSNPTIALALSQILARKLHYVTSYLVDLKRQFEDSGDHLAMVGEVIECLVHHQPSGAVPGSDRCPEPDPMQD